MSIIRHVMLSFVLILAALGIPQAAVAQPAPPGVVWYVDANVSGGAEDGSTWGNAIPDLQTAITLSIAGDHIWVANGLYIPSVPEPSTSTDPRHFTFKLKDGVKIYGAFMGQDRPGGGETLLSQRGDPSANPSVLYGVVGQPLPSQPGSWPVCGSGGSCTEETPGIPGCADINCCKAICNQPETEACCTEEWGLDCVVAAQDLNCPDNRAFHIVRSMSGVTPSATLNGFEITMGRATNGD